MLALDIDRLTPFRADQVFVDVLPGGSGVAQVAAIPRALAVEAMADARSAGLEPRALGLAGGDPAVDFLPAMREAGAIARGPADRRLIWVVLAGLLILNFAAAIGRDIWQVRRLRDQLAAEQPAIDRVQALRRRVQREAARRADIIARRVSAEPLRMLDSVTGAIPNGAWVDRLAFDGQSVRVSGYRQDQIDVARGLRDAALLTNVRNSGAEASTRQAAGQPFDITADLKTARSR
jgi:Tfp pilus assembly protein PilN